MKRIPLIIVGMIVVAVIAISMSSATRYENPKYGISFEHPRGYALSEQERGDGHREHYSIVLVKEEESVPPVSGEGPTAITVDIYQNNLDQLSLMKWVTMTNESNYKLSGRNLVPARVDSEDALAYEWSGLYEGKTTVFRHAGNIVAVSVTYASPADEGLSAYAHLLESIRLRNTPAIADEQAVSLLKAVHSELASYPSDNLPPKRIRSERTNQGWNVAFITFGSGLPGILSAVCYSVSDAQEIMKIGEYVRGTNIPSDDLNLSTCRPQMYTSKANGFSLRLPDGYVAKESSEGVSFTIPASMAAGTNLSTDSRISVEQMSKVSDCSAKLFMDEPVTAKTLTENGMTYSVATSSGAGAGNRYEEIVYAIPKTNPCLAIRYFIHSTVVENYPEGTVKEFDKKALLDQFDQIRRSLVISR